ncbi:site-2 protease family protein [Candidatus Woesearchaeota archaeon]|nr:site-2 protease family protein [Candidatus Woesearchaeota archaeon]
MVTHYYFKPPKRYKVGPYYFSKIELRDLAKAWVAISLAFAILFTGGNLFNLMFVLAFIASGFTVGLGFLLHELGHKVVAQRYGCITEFRSFDHMLVIAVIVAFLGFVFAAPGAVLIGGRKVSKKENGKISTAGPLMNIVLALVFLMLSFVVGSVIGIVMYYGFMINSLLALFNMLPFPNFDGVKVYHWNKAVYFVMLVFSIILMISAYSFSIL